MITRMQFLTKIELDSWIPEDFVSFYETDFCLHIYNDQYDQNAVKVSSCSSFLTSHVYSCFLTRLICCIRLIISILSYICYSIAFHLLWSSIYLLLVALFICNIVSLFLMSMPCHQLINCSLSYNCRLFQVLNFCFCWILVIGQVHFGYVAPPPRNKKVLCPSLICDFSKL